MTVFWCLNVTWNVARNLFHVSSMIVVPEMAFS